MNGGFDCIPVGMHSLLKTVSDCYSQLEELLKTNNQLVQENESAVNKYSIMKNLLESNDAIFFSIDCIENKFIQLSSTCEKVYGYSQDSFYENINLWKQVIYKNDIQNFESEFTEILSGNKNLLEYRINHLDGSLKWLEVKITPTINNTGKLSRIDGVWTDITFRKNTEIELRESQLQIQNIFNASLDAVVILNEDGTISQWDSKAEHLFGRKKEEVTGNCICETIIPEKLRKDCKSELQQFLKTGTGSALTKTIELKAVSLNKVEFDISFSISPTIIKNKFQFIVFIRDITFRKNTEEVLQLNEKRFRNLIENNEDVISLLDKKSEILYQSPAAERILGFTFEERRKNPGLVYIHPDDLDEAKKIFAQVMNNPGIAYPFQHRKLHKNGHYVWVEGIITNMFDKESVNAVVANFRDITRRKQAENAVLESEKKYRGLFETMVDGVYKSSREGKFIEVNPALVKMLGYDSKEELMNLDIKSNLYFEPSDRDKVVNQEQIAEMDIYRLKKKDGSELWVEDSGRYVTDENGEILYHEGIIRDVTKRTHTELQLMSSRKETDNYKKALDQSLIVSLTDTDGIFEYVNENYCKISEYTYDELVGKHCLLLKCDDSNEKFYNDIKETTSSGLVWRGEIKQKNKNGIHFWVDSTIVPFLNENDQPYQFLVISVDITKRKAIEEKLEYNEKRFRAMVESGADAVAVLSEDGKPMYISPSISNILGYSEAEVMKMDIFTLLHPDDIPGVAEVMAKTISNPGIPIPGHIGRMRHKNGTWRWLDATLTNMLHDPAIGGIIDNFRDITDTKEQQDELENSYKELKKSNLELDKFVYSVSHDLRAPLLSMQGIVGITAEETKEPDTVEHMHMLNGSITRLDNFIGEILEYSRNARHEVKKDKINFETMLKNITDDLKYMNSGNKQVSIEVAINETGTFFSDHRRLAVVINNLLSNSIRYYNPSEAYSFVKINIDSNASGAQIIIEDNGIGISENNHNLIYDMFYRVSENSVGSGLGLYIVKETITKLKGEIVLESYPGKGTKFKLKIPNIFYQ